MKALVTRINFRDALLFIWYGALAALSAYVLLWWQFFTDQPFHSEMFYTYNSILAGTEPAPFQYRYVAYLLPEIIHRVTGYSLQTSEAFHRVFWLWMSALALHAYLSHWFNRSGAIIGALGFLATASLFVVQTSFAPSDLPAFCFLLLSLLALQRRNYGWLLFTVPVGMLFRETIVFVFVVWGVYFCFERDQRVQIPYLTGSVVLAALVFVGLRLYFGFRTYDPYVLPKNLADIRGPLRVALLFNVFLIIPFFTLKTAPRFLRYTAALVPVVSILNVLFALAKDSRLWLPLVPSLIPLGLIYLVSDTRKEEEATPQKVPATQYKET